MSELDPKIFDEELIAYLDGELDDKASTRVERRLSDDPKYREQLQGLQSSWDMLDLLPKAQASDTFTQSTVELVAVKAAEKIEQDKSQWLTRKTALWIGSVAGVILAAVIGFSVTRRIATAKNRQLARDLPVIENVDLYYHVDDIEFLRMLADEDIFGAELSEIDDAS